jgi:hypothetical protein
MVHERATHSPPSASPGGKQHSASAILRSPSFGPNWPLGLGRATSPRNPLASHPVMDLEKRLSLHDLPPQPQPQPQAQNRVPILQVPTPPPSGTRLAPPPPPKRKSKTLRMSTGGSPTSASGPTTAALQSPRLSYIPAPPIDAAFGDELEKGLSSVAAPTTRTKNSQTAASSSTSPLLAAGSSSLETLDQTLDNNNIGATRKRLTNHSIFVDTSWRSSSPADDEEPVSPVSPLSEDGDAPVNQRISLVSESSAPGDIDRGGLDDLVSPISPEDGHGDAESAVSPVSVSPLESRRSSFGE